MSTHAPNELEELRKRLEVAQRDLARLEQITPLAHLASTVVHDIRNSLGIISSTAQFVLSNFKPQDREKQAWELVTRNVENIQKILKSYLGFARQVEGEKEECAINEIVSRVHHFVTPLASKQNTRLQVTLDPGNPVVLANVAALESSVLNMALNALEALERDGTLRFATRKEQNRWIVEISDTGPGIPKEVREKLFQPFFTTKRTGTGMGLYSAKEAVVNNGGQIECLSEPGKGTRMVLSFPAGGAS